MSLCGRKLQGVGEQIGQNLVKPKRISYKILGNLTTKENLKVNLLAERLNMEHSRQRPQETAKIKALEIQLYLAALNFGHIQDIVNQGKQVV